MESRARARSRVGDVSRGLSSQTIPCRRDPARHGSPLVTCHNELGPFSCRLLDTSSRRTLPARFIRLKDILTDIAIFSIRSRFCFAWNWFAKRETAPFISPYFADRPPPPPPPLPPPLLPPFNEPPIKSTPLYLFWSPFIAIRSSNGLFFATEPLQPLQPLQSLLRLHVSWQARYFRIDLRFGIERSNQSWCGVSSDAAFKFRKISKHPNSRSIEYFFESCERGSSRERGYNAVHNVKRRMLQFLPFRELLFSLVSRTKHCARARYVAWQDTATFSS